MGTSMDVNILYGTPHLVQIGSLLAGIPTTPLNPFATSPFLSSELDQCIQYGEANRSDSGNSDEYGSYQSSSFITAHREFQDMTCGLYAQDAYALLFGNNDLAKTDDSIELKTALLQSREDAEQAVQKAVESFGIAFDILEAVLGEGGAVTSRMQEGMASLQGALTILSGMGDLCDAIETRTEQSVVDSHAIPEVALTLATLSPEAISAVPNLGAEIASAALMGLQRIFPRDSQEISEQKLDAFLKATDVFKSRMYVPGSKDNMLDTITALLDHGINHQDARGIFYEFMRIAHLMSSGRNIDEINAIISDLTIDGWWFDSADGYFYCTPSTCDLEVDAREGDTLIEVKTASINGDLGEFIKILIERCVLPHKSPIHYYIDRDKFDNRGVWAANRAAKTVSQLLRYRKAMETDGVRAKKLELHVTSARRVPDKVAQAIYSLFPEGAMDIVWYDRMSSKRGFIVPRYKSTRAPDSSPPATARSPRKKRSDRWKPTLGSLIGKESDMPKAKLPPKPPPSSRGMAERESDDQLRRTLSSHVSRNERISADVGNNANNFIDWVIEEHRDRVSYAGAPLSQRVVDLFAEWSEIQTREPVGAIPSAPPSIEFIDDEATPEASSPSSEPPISQPPTPADYDALKQRASELFYGQRRAYFDQNPVHLEQFMTWAVDNHGEALIGLSKGALSKRLSELFADWHELQVEVPANGSAQDDRATSAATEDQDEGWREITDKKAKRRFNKLLNQCTNKSSTLDWQKSTTRGIQNTDILEVLSSLLKDSAIDNNQELKDLISEFMQYLKDNYRPEAYFKTKADGPRLVEIMKRYIYLTDRKPMKRRSRKVRT